MNENPDTAETQHFVEIFNKFFDLLNIQSPMESIRTRNTNKEPYKSPNDDRLKVRIQFLIVLCFIHFLN